MRVNAYLFFIFFEITRIHASLLASRLIYQISSISISMNTAQHCPPKFRHERIHFWLLLLVSNLSLNEDIARSLVRIPSCRDKFDLS